MVVPIVFFSIVVVVVAGIRVRRWWRHRDDPPMFITTWPEIEYFQPYGGWDADAYDAGTGRDPGPLLRRCAPPSPGLSSRSGSHLR